MLTWQDPRKNHLLRSLSESDYVRLEPALELVTLQGGQVLCEPCTKSRHGYFPVSAVVSLVGLSDAGVCTPIAEIHEDGLAGVLRLLGGSKIPYHCITLISGGAYRVQLDLLQAEFDSRGGFQQIVLGYLQLLMIQMAQSAKKI